MAHPGAIVVPYIGMIPGGMIPGKKIIIHGMVVPTCNRFSVNFQCGPNVNPRDDIALHMNFRYDQQVPYVVRNSLQMQQWGIEEGHGYLSFARGQNFEIHIHVEHDHFKVLFNGNHFTDFRFRIPIQRVTYIAIDGEVIIHGVKADGYDIAPHGMGIRFGGAPPFYGAPHPGMPPAAHGMPPHGAHMYPTHPTGGYPTHGAAIPVAVGAGMVMGAHMDKKSMKKQKKAMKKAMKHNKHGHGMHGHPHHGHHGGHHKGSSSSSSSSSSSEEE